MPGGGSGGREVKTPGGYVLDANGNRIEWGSPAERQLTEPALNIPLYTDSGRPVIATGDGSGYIGRLRPYNSKYYAPGFSVTNGSVRLAVDGSHRIFNEVVNPDGSSGGVFDPVEGEAKDLKSLLASTFSPRAKLELLKFASSEFATHTQEAAELDFLLNPSAETQARLNYANAPIPVSEARPGAAADGRKLRSGSRTFCRLWILGLDRRFAPWG